MKKQTDLTCFLIDDELHDIEHFISLIQDTNGVILKGVSVNPVEALSIIETGTIDITFIDVNMSGMSGIDFAQAAKDFTHIVFTSSSYKPTPQIFFNESFDYLPKPVSLEKFRQCVDRIKRGR